MIKNFIFVVAMLSLAPRVWAQEESSDEAREAVEAPKKPAPKSLPGIEAPAKPLPPPVPCLLSGPMADGEGCAGYYRKVAEGYLEAYKAMDAWLSAASAEVSGAEETVKKFEQSVRENETAMTALKLDRSKEAKLKLRELDKANKQIWRELEAARANQAAVCKGLSRSAAQKVKDLTLDLTQRLAQAQKSGT